MPCPSAILPISLLVEVRGAVPIHLVIVPILWSVVGGSAAIFLGVPTDYVLLAAGGALLISKNQEWDLFGLLDVVDQRSLNLLLDRGGIRELCRD